MISDSMRAWMEEIEKSAAARGYEAGMRDCATDHRRMIRHARVQGGEDLYDGIQRARWPGAWRALWACLGLLVAAVALGGRG
jgi:hypothetical protein